MTGNELFSKIILSLNSYLGFNDRDLIDLIDIDDDLENAIQKILSLNPPSPFNLFIESLDRIRIENIDNFLNTPYSLVGSVNTIDFSQPKFVNRNRRFAYSDTQFSFVSTKALFDNGNLIDLSDLKYRQVWKLIEEFLERNYSVIATAIINHFFDIIGSLNNNYGLVINKTGNPFNEDEHYPYIYLCFLNNSNSIILPDQLKYSSSNIYTGLSYNSTKNYEQYFDIYDVLNELNQAPDILNRFLRLYHTFEYLVYRVYLVDLVSRVGGSRLFVREFITSAESMHKGERDSFIKNFDKIFSADLTTTIEPGLTSVTNAPVIAFLSSKKIVRAFNPNNIKHIAQLIYGLRCCIVHNKESEYHMTISNSDDYQILIPMIRKVLEVFEGLVVKKIAENHPEINYTQKSVNLY